MGAWRLEWCSAPSKAEDLASFMFGNMDTSYISHSELQLGRAENIAKWASNLRDMLVTELAERLREGPDGNTRVSVAQRDGAVVAISLVKFTRDVPIRHVVIEDLVVERSQRGKGIGQAMLEWILGQAKREGMQRAFLESGLSNSSAHSFFKRNNFHQVSIVMMADLGT